MPTVRHKINIQIDSDLALEYCKQLRQIKVDLELLKTNKKISVSENVKEFLELMESTISSALVEQLPQDKFDQLIQNNK